MILVDSSVWIEFDRATGSSSHLRLRSLIEDGGDLVAVSEPILMEVLAGASPTNRAPLSRLLRSFSWIPVDPVADFEGAAKIYSECRRQGITPRGLIDCMIANIALRTRTELLAVNGDFPLMATVVPLRLSV